MCVQITGPLIRIIGDRFPWQIKAAILKTLGLLIGYVCGGHVHYGRRGFFAAAISASWLTRPTPPHSTSLHSRPDCRKAGAGLKPFVPQLQTTFVKCLSDPQKEVG